MGAPSTPSRTRQWRRPLLIGGAALVVIALVAATWALAEVFQSPAQREANASAPPPQPVFAEVTTGVLADQRSYSGTVTYTDEATFTLPAAADAARSVVTSRPPSVGGRITSGDLLTEVNTRPVFVIASPFDFFRDIGFGDEGADVRVLQEALVSRGYLSGVDGAYGSQTALAVARWYQGAGYQAPTRERTVTDSTSGASDDAGSSNDPGSPDSDAGAASAPTLDAFVPVSEVLAVSSLPATIIAAPSVGANVGEDSAADLTLGTNSLIVRAEVPATETVGIAPGDPVTVVSGSGQIDAVVASVEPQTPDDDGAPRPSVVTVELGTDPAELAAERGETVTVQVQNAVVAEESLLVPTAAVVGRGEGRGVVVKRQTDGSLVEVPVSVAGSLRGTTAVEPDEAGSLGEGDEVRVG